MCVSSTAVRAVSRSCQDVELQSAPCCHMPAPSLYHRQRGQVQVALVQGAAGTVGSSLTSTSGSSCLALPQEARAQATPMQASSRSALGLPLSSAGLPARTCSAQGGRPPALVRPVVWEPLAAAFPHGPETGAETRTERERERERTPHCWSTSLRHLECRLFPQSNKRGYGTGRR